MGIECLSSSEYGLRDDECVWVSRFSVPADTPFGTHAHALSQLIWVSSGQMLATVARQQWVLAPSQAVWVPGGVPHDIEAVRDSDVHTVYLWDEECPRDWPNPVPVRMSALSRELIRYLAREDLDDAAARRARGTLLDVLEPLRVSPIDLPMPRDARGRRIATSILADPSLPHTLSGWAMRLHTSEKTIQRTFSAETGMTFSEWRIQARLFCALPLLADSLPISSVATRIGYTSTNGFTSAFRTRFGTTPGTFFEDGTDRGHRARSAPVAPAS